MTLKVKRALEWSIFSCLGLMFVSAGVLLYYQNSYSGKIYKNVKVASIDVSGLNKKQAETLIKKKFDAVSASEITFEAGAKNVTSKLSDTGLTFDVSASVDKAYAVGRSSHFLPQLYASAQTALVPLRISVPMKIDQTKLNLFISEKLPGLTTQPSDAKIIIADGKVVIEPEQNGQQVDTSNLTEKISKLVSEGSKKMLVRLEAISSQPAITSQALEPLKSEAEGLINTPISIAYEGKTYSPTTVDKSKWISIASAEGGAKVVALDDAAIKAYLTRIAKDFEIIKKDRKINASNNAVIQEGVQGKYLEKDKAVTAIKLGFKNPGTITLTTYTQDPTEVKVYPAEGVIPGKYPGKYLDVDVAQQRLCRIQDNQVVDCFIISSGKASTPTPLGTRYIESKETKRWSAPYGLWMPYWQALGGGYGIHELPEWPNGYKEGESHLGTPVSHGCIRLGIGAAASVYEWTEIGMPVYIHK